MEQHGGHVRPPRRCDPPRLRPADRLVDPPHPRAPRAGRRPHGRGVRPRDRSSRGGHGHQRPGGDQHRHAPVRRLHGQRPDRRHDRPGALLGDRYRRLPGGGHGRDHDADHQAQLARHRRLRHPAGGARGVPRRHDRPARPGAHRHAEGRRQPGDELVLARRGRPPGLQAHHQGPRQADQGRGAAHGRGGAPGDLRGRRHPQGARRRGAARAGRAHRVPRGDDADGAGAFPDDHDAVPGHAGHARQLHRHHRDAAVRPADRAGLALRRPRRPARSTAFAPGAKIIHVDIDPAELGKVRRPDVPIVGDCRLVIEEMVKAVRAEKNKRERGRRSTAGTSSCASGRSSSRSTTSSWRTGRSSRST